MWSENPEVREGDMNKLAYADEPERAIARPVPVVTRPAIVVRDTNVIYPALDHPVQALKNINLTVRQGEFISLIGPSGCGKTTLLRIIADLEPITSGEVLVNDMTPSEARQAGAYGYVFQAPVLLPWRTVLANVMLPLQIQGKPALLCEEIAREQLARVGLNGFEKKFPWQLSGGMQQRASIARALGFAPKILMMDEPFGALDELTRDNLNQQLRDLWAEEQRTVVFVTHSIAEAVYLSTRIVVMSPRPGRILKVIDSTLPHERSFALRDSPEFIRLAQEVREALVEGHV
jgi:NitT/TauT family transport system ATP-binding protein